MYRNQARAGACAAAAILIAGCGTDPPSMAPADAPNVLLISLDSSRRDFFSCYGHRPAYAAELATTPNIDGLANEGVLFENASATSSWTLPSHVSLLSGLSEVAHGVDLHGQRVSEDLPLLAESLAQNGYRTAGFFSGPYLDPRFGFGRGFATYASAYGAELDRAWIQSERTSHGIEDAGDVEANTLATQVLEVASHSDSSSRRVTDAVLRELEARANDEAPFFIFAHYFDPHYDYLPPAPYDTLFDPAYDGRIDGSDFYTRGDIATFTGGTASGRERTVSERDLQHLVALYEGEMAWTDHQVGRVLEKLEELGLTQDTLVILTADHGDEFFEHDGIGHRRTLFEEVLAVPLIIRWPGRIQARTRVRSTVSLADVTPTILDAIGLEPSQRSLLPPAQHDVDRGTMARLVRTELAGGSANGDASTDISVTESWRLGSIKVTRSVAYRWPGDSPGSRGDVGAGKVRLTWTDLALNPREIAEHESTDFDSPAARAALQAFHDEYVALLAARHAPHNDPINEQIATALSALGYVAVESTQGTVPAAALVLPPPGESILGASG